MTMTKAQVLALVMVGVGLLAIAFMLATGYFYVSTDGTTGGQLSPLAAALITFGLVVGGITVFAIVAEADLK